VRISLLGGGTDFPAYYEKHGGAVLSTAINSYVDVIVRDRFFDDIVIDTSEKEVCQSVSEIKHNLIREAMRMVAKDLALDWSKVEIATLADIPGHGIGLGSSASVTVGVLNALYNFAGQSISPEELARKAYQIEAEILGYPAGVQDQLIASYGGFRFIELDKDINISNPLDTGDLSDYLLLFYTETVRQGKSILTPFVNSIQSKASILNEMTELARTGYKVFLERDWEQLGHLIDTSWEVKKQYSNGVSNSFIDDLYDKAKSLGAWGCKISGAGGGGFFLAMAPKEKREQIVRGLGLRELPFRFEEKGSSVIYNDGGHTGAKPNPGHFLIAFDVDGTLSGWQGSITAKQINKLNRENVTWGILCSRPIESSTQVCCDIGINPHFIRQCEVDHRASYLRQLANDYPTQFTVYVADRDIDRQEALRAGWEFYYQQEMNNLLNRIEKW